MLSFNTQKNLFPVQEKKTGFCSSQNAAFKPVYTKNLTKDTVSFQKKNKVIHEAVVEDLSYQNVLGKSLKSSPNLDFEVRLKEYSSKKKLSPAAKKRIASFSKYLKEGMVGMIVPEYTLDGVQKGGYEWFEKGLESLLRGSAPNAKPEEYTKLAEELFELLSLHDNYWKSNEFVKYLRRFKNNKAAEATIQAVKNIQARDKKTNLSFTGEMVFKTAGYFTPLKYMDKLLELGCAYSGTPLRNRNPQTPEIDIPRDELASADHIVTRTGGGKDEDYNYIICSSEVNSKRLSTKLINFLRGF